ncbi:LptF/LptG family permease [bacterium]|jgi:lipopolysaccharide export system permease protein|nr:LptF/LptG family permease [bacterium]
MKILSRYILKDFFTNFFSILIIFTFALLIGNLIELTQLLIKGFKLSFVFKMIFNIIPYLLTYTIPLACLVASLFLFGKLSANHEITAMKSSGLSLFYISKPLFIAAFLIGAFCFVVSSYISPSCHYVIRKSKKIDIGEIGNINPVQLIEKGVFIEAFHPYIIYCDDKTENTLKNLMIFEVKSDAPATAIFAKEGSMEYDDEEGMIKLELMEGNIDAPNPEDPKKFFRLSFENYHLELDIPSRDEKYIPRSANDMPLGKLTRKIKEYEKNGVNNTPLKVEFSTRIATSFSCIIFTLIAIPLGIKAHRSEKTIGIALGLCLALCYYSFIILAKAIDKESHLYPEYIVWLPNIALFLTGAVLFYRINKQ